VTGGIERPSILISMDRKMIRLLSSLVLLFALVAPSFGAATLTQAFISTGNSIASVDEPGNAFQFTIPYSVGSGDCLVMSLTYPNGATISSISDTINGSWSTTAAVTANGGNGNNNTSIFLKSSSSGTTDTITITFSASQQPVMWRVEDWVGVTCSSNGTAAAANQTYNGSAAMSTGSFTPGDNNANGGNLILAFFDFSRGGVAGSNPTSWSAASGFTLMDADIGWNNDQGLPKASEYFTQTTSASISPSITPTGDTTDPYNAVAIALALSSSGTSPGSGIRMVKFIEQFNSAQTASTWVLQFPTTGNLRVFGTTVPTSQWNITSITDSEGNTWTNDTLPDGLPQMYHLANASANPDLTITLHVSGSPSQIHGALYDIANAATSPLGASGQNTAGANSVTSVSNEPDITPDYTDSLIIGLLSDGLGPTIAITSPSGVYSDIVSYTGGTDSSNYSSGDGWGHLYNTSTSSQNWTWKITNQSSNSVGSLAVEFKSASATKSHDFNGDGKSDIAWRDTSGDAAVWLMNGAQVLQTGGVGTANLNVWTIVGQRDFNGDGRADLLWRDSSGDVAMWFLNGTQVTQSAGVGNVPSVWSVFGTGDFNGDGMGDILWQDSNGDVAIWLMNGAQVIQAAGIGNAPPGVWQIVGTGDFNGDGKSDILWQDTSGDVAIWFMNGTQITQAVGVGNAPPSVWKIVGTGDFNGDGKSDILWQDTSGDVAIWLMNGSQITQSAGVGSVSLSLWSIIETGDFNGDGKSDILWQDTSGDVAIWFMNGTQVTQAAGIGNVPTAVWTIQNANAD
jgi:hypothetical protein